MVVIMMNIDVNVDNVSMDIPSVGIDIHIDADETSVVPTPTALTL